MGQVTQVAIAKINMDHSIQCRVGIDMETVSDYVERTKAGERAPAIDVFGSNGSYWIGDGWHRVMAASQMRATSIDAVVHAGGRQDALKHALRANTQHGLRRTNADKRRCVEIAIAEFSTLSSRQIAGMCGVADDFVGRIRNQVRSNSTSPVTGADGKKYPATRKPKEIVAVDSHLKHGTPQAEAAKVISGLLATGHNVAQISAAIGRAEETTRRIIIDYKLAKLARGGKNTAKISPAHVIRETVNAVAATGQGLRLIHKLPLDLSKDESTELLAALREAMRELQWLVNTLKEKTND